MPQAVVNIGLVGHIDHGKTTLTEALSGVWTDTHSEELKRGITIRLGYADTEFYRCKECGRYTTKQKCPYCGGKTELLRRVSFVDAPGHETLMATMLSGAAIMDGAILVVAANEPCPQPQTKEHLMALQIAGVKNVVVVQNKVELVSKEKVMENYRQIREFLSATEYRDAPVIPISAVHRVNIDVLIETIERRIPTPKRDLKKPPLMFVARSFDINKPGTRPERLQGGVVGGSLLHGKLKLEDEVSIRPGLVVSRGGKSTWQHLDTKISSLYAMNSKLDEAVPGGLIGVGTKLDPALTKSDSLVGSVLGLHHALPEVTSQLEMEVHLLERVVGLQKEVEVQPLSINEPVMVSVGTAARAGMVTRVKGNSVRISLRYPVCVNKEWRAAISRRIANKWRLIGYGIVA